MRVAALVIPAVAVALCMVDVGEAQPAGGPAGPESMPAASQPTKTLPVVSNEDLAVLVKMSRRAFEDAVGGMPERGVTYRPGSLAGLSGTVHLTMRSQGVALVQAASGEMDIAEAVVKAGALAGRAAVDKSLKFRNRGEELGLELEWLGPREYLSVGCDEGGRWTDRLLHAFEPGGEGIGVEFRGARAWTRPSEIIVMNYTPDLAIQAAEAAIGLTHADKLRFRDEVRYFRFRAYHLWQPTSRAKPVLLLRGAALVSAEHTGVDDVESAVQRMGRYLHYRQNRDGWFSHEYLPTADRYGEGNSAQVQMTALYGLAAYAAWSGRPDVMADAKKGVRRSAFFLTPLAVLREVGEQGEAKFGAAGYAVDFPGHQKQLELSAKMLLALLELAGDWPTDARLWEATSSQPATGPSPMSEDETRGIATTGPAGAAFGEMPPGRRWADLTVGGCISGLVEGLLASQLDDGRLEMVLDGQNEGASEDVGAAGWALLALASAHRCFSKEAISPTSAPADVRTTSSEDVPVRIERTLLRALGHYQRVCRGPVEPTAAAALSRGLCGAYVCTNDARASDLAFEILDQFAGVQVTSSRCPWPELEGAINARRVGVIGIDTAAYMSAVADGAFVAERIGDKERVRRYREVCRVAARFILQMEIREEGAFYIRSPQDALGGVRTSPWDNRVRVDYCAEAMMSLMWGREVLYGPRASGRR